MRHASDHDELPSDTATLQAMLVAQAADVMVARTKGVTAARAGLLLPQR